MTFRRTIWLLFALFVVYGCTIPFEFGSLAKAQFKLQYLPLNPLVTPGTLQRQSIPDAFQNVLLFFPFGAIGWWAGGRSLRVVPRIVWVTALGAGLSVLVEALQLLTVDRTGSVGDVLFNTFGAFLGAVLAWQFRRPIAAGYRRLKIEGLLQVPELRPMAIAAAALAIVLWQPFDVTLDVSTVAANLRSLEANPWRLAERSTSGTAFMLSALFAMTLASYLSVVGERHGGRRAAVLGIVATAFMEGAEIFIGSRTPEVWDAVVNAVGVLTGVAIWSIASRVVWPALWLSVLAALTAVAGGVQMLTPFTIAGAHAFMWQPFVMRGGNLQIIGHVLETTLLYFPLGFWLGGTRQGVRSVLVLGCLLAVLIAAPLEYAQGWIVRRHSDLADVALAIAGVWIGIGAYNGRRA